MWNFGGVVYVERDWRPSFSFVADLDCFFPTIWNYVLFGRFLVERRPPPPNKSMGQPPCPHNLFSSMDAACWFADADLNTIPHQPDSRHWWSSSSKGDCCCICLCVSRSRGVEAFVFLNKLCMRGSVVFFLAVSSGRKEIMIKKWMIWRMIWDTCLVGVWHGRERCSADGIWCSPSMMWAGGLKKSKCGLPSCHWIHPSPADQNHISHTLHGARQIYYIFWTTQTWICIRWLFALYHGKPPWNHHLRGFFLLFPSISSKCKQNRPAPWSDLG